MDRRGFIGTAISLIGGVPVFGALITGTARRSTRPCTGSTPPEPRVWGIETQETPTFIAQVSRDRDEVTKIALRSKIESVQEIEVRFDGRVFLSWMVGPGQNFVWCPYETVKADVVSFHSVWIEGRRSGHIEHEVTRDELAGNPSMMRGVPNGEITATEAWARREVGRMAWAQENDPFLKDGLTYQGVPWPSRPRLDAEPAP